MFEKEAARALEKALHEKAFNAKTLQEWLEFPPKPELGHLAFPCHKLAPALKKAPNQIAQELARAMKKEKWLREVQAQGPYLNFFFESNFFRELN